MPRQKDALFRQICGEVDQRKVARILDEYGRPAAVERWHWCAGHVDALAAEGRRMVAAGEKWVRAPREPEPEDEPLKPAEARPYQMRIVAVRPAIPVPKPAPAAAPKPAPASKADPSWTFPMERTLLLRKARTTTIPTLAMMLGVSGREVRDAIEIARKAA